MFKNIFIVAFLLFGSASYAMGNKKNNISQNINQNIEITFRQLMKYYKEENEDSFFALVDKDNFLQDYMLFRQAVEKDFRTYEILDFDYWIDKITSDGSKRYLYVKWKKLVQNISNSNAYTQKGNSRLLFEKINGKYKLIELGGDALWGGSLKEWKMRLPQISDQ